MRNRQKSTIFQFSADLILRFCSLTFSKGKAKDPQASKGRFSVLRLAYTGDC